MYVLYWSKLYILIFLWIVLVHALFCDRTSIITGSIEDCIDDGNEVKCKYVTSAQINLRNLGSRVCLSLRDNDKIVANISISYKKFTVELNTVLQYYTSNFLSYNTWDHRCSGSQHCNNGGCLSTNPTNPTYWGILSTSLLNHPGFSRCRRTTGGLSVGCVSTGRSCVFDGYWFEPKSPYATVFGIGQESDIITTEIDIEYFGKPNKKVILQNRNVITSNGILFTIIGTTNRNTIDFGNRKLVKFDNGTNALVLATNANEYSVGLIGDIQSPTKEGLTSDIKRDSFFYTPDIVSTIDHSDSTTFSFKKSGITNIQSPYILPYNLDNYRIICENNKLTAEPLSTPTLLFNLEFNNFSIIRRTNKVCPICSLMAAEGCRNCLSGVDVYITARSYCLSGIVSVNSNANITLLTKNIQILTTDKIFLIRFNTNTRYNIYNLTLSSDSGISCTVSINFNATDEILVGNPNEFAPSVFVPSAESEENRFNFRWDFSKWWHFAVPGMTMVIIIIAIIIILLKRPFCSK